MRQLADIDIAINSNGLHRETNDDDAFDADPVGQDAEDDAAEKPGKAFDAIDAGRCQRRGAAQHGIADRMEDRA
ncbi:hypothetical protein D3C86_2220950 [compost metagenome]